MLNVDRPLARRLWPRLAPSQAALLLCFLLGIGAEVAMAGEGDEAVRLGTLGYYVPPLLVGYLTAALLLLLLAPLAGFILTALFSIASAFVPDASSLGLLWLAPAALACFAVFLQLRGLAAHRSLNRRLPAHGDFPSSIAYRSPRIGLLLLVGLPVLAVGLFAWHQVVLADVMAFEARAERASARVISTAVDDAEFTVSIGGTQHVLDSGNLESEPAVGEEVPVLVDPLDPQRITPVGAIDDPSFLLLLGLLALLLVPYPYARWVRPARERQRLVADGGPAYRARLLDLPSGATYLLPAAGLWPAVRLTDFEPVVSAAEIQEQLDGDEPEEEDEDEAPLPTSVDELERYLREDPWPEEDAELGELYFGPDATRPVAVEVVGSPRLGASVAIVHGERLWFTQVHPTNWRPRLRSEIQQAARGALPPSLITRILNFHPQLARLLWAVAATAGILVLVGLGVLAEEWWRPLFMAGSLAASGFLLSVGDGAATLRPGRLTLHGTLRDEVVVPGQVVAVAEADDLLALRVSDPDDVIVLTAEAVLTRFGGTGQEALERIALWRGMGDTGARPGPRLSLLVWLTAGTVAVGLAALGVVLW